MSLSRSLSRFLSSSNPQKWFRLRSSFSTDTQTKSPIKRAFKRNPQPSASEFPRPSEIPFQAKVANSVQLVGSIGVPVQLQHSPTGICAVAILVQGTRKKDSPKLCIPVIFQGDLAHVAACHLKEKDLVYVTGQLSGHALPQTVEDEFQKTVEDAHTHVQVFANSLSFVQKTCPENEGELVHNQGSIASVSLAEVEQSPSDLHSWNDLFAHPYNWWDNRLGKSNPEHASFKHKKSSKQLWINDSTPEWVQSKLDTLSFRRTPPNGMDGTNNGVESLWHDLVDNSQQWRDIRGDKLKGSVSLKYPDFKHTYTKKGLWLDTAPDWVLSKIDGLAFCDSNITSKNEKENLWKNLVENPDKWWDNRSSKLKPNHPDFKHKDSGEALWLGSSTPPWVLPKLPSLATKEDVKPE